MKITCFKAYDIRGKLIEQIDEKVAYRIGRAFSQLLNAKTVVLGADVRLTSKPLKLALAAGLVDGGTKVTDLGMTGTEEIYFATKHLAVDGGIEVTASHNPIDYNGMKLVKDESRPISGDSGLFAIRDLAESFPAALVAERIAAYAGKRVSKAQFLQGQGTVSEALLTASGLYTKSSTMDAYVKHVLSYIDGGRLQALKLVVNAGNGAAGAALDAIEARLQAQKSPLQFVKIHHQADGTFPNGIPNPLLADNRADTSNAVLANKADMGIAWDGDFDRCFLFDEKGNFIEGYYIVGLLAKAFLDKQAGCRIIYDPRVYWNTEDIIAAAGGVAIKSKTGHAFIKERMRADDAVYGGEMSAHHYFRDFAYCDSGMLPWLLVAELISAAGKPLSALVKERIAAFPSSGEINSLLEDPDAAIERVLAACRHDAVAIDDTDGIGLEFDAWRFNLRKSNTEPVLRLNVESRGDIALMKRKTDELLKLIRQ